MLFQVYSYLAWPFCSGGVIWQNIHPPGDPTTKELGGYRALSPVVPPQLYKEQLYKLHSLYWHMAHIFTVNTSQLSVPTDGSTNQLNWLLCIKPLCKGVLTEDAKSSLKKFHVHSEASSFCWFGFITLLRGEFAGVLAKSLVGQDKAVCWGIHHTMCSISADIRLLAVLMLSRCVLLDTGRAQVRL